MEKSKNLWEILQETDFEGFYDKTKEFLLKEGFEEFGYNLFGNELHKLYVLDDPNGQLSIGKSYAFLLTEEERYLRLAISKVEGWKGFAYGLLNLKDSELTPEIVKIREEFDNFKSKERIKFYYGRDAVRALVRSIEIKNAIAEAEAKGLYDVFEHRSCQIDLDE